MLAITREALIQKESELSKTAGDSYTAQDVKRARRSLWKADSSWATTDGSIDPIVTEPVLVDEKCTTTNPNTNPQG